MELALEVGEGTTGGELILPPDDGRIGWPSQSRAGELAPLQMWDSQKADLLSHHRCADSGIRAGPPHYLLECMKGSVLKPERGLLSLQLLSRPAL